MAISDLNSTDKQQAFAVGALFASEYAGSLGGVTKNIEELTVNGAIVGMTEPINTTSKTYCTKYYDYDYENYGYFAPYSEFKEFIYTALSDAKIDYPIEHISNKLIGDIYITGASIKLTNNVNMLIYYEQYSLKQDDDLVRIGSSNGTSGIGVLNFALENNGVICNHFDASTKYSSQNNKFRLEFKVNYYDFDTNKFLWVNSKTILWPYTNDILYLNGLYKNLADLNMNMGYDTYGMPKPSKGDNYPFVMITPKYCSEKMKADNNKATKYPYFLDQTNNTNYYLEDASIVLMCKSNLNACKVTLCNDDSKYFYIKYDDGIAHILDKGTMG